MAKTASDTKRRVQVLDEIKNSDFTAARNEYHFRTPFLVDRLSPLLKDQRDIPMLCLLLNILEIVVPGALVVYGINMWEPPHSLIVRNIAGVAYCVSILLLFQERFTLCIHFASHRSIFHNDALNLAIGWLFAPFFGIPSGVYKLHHVIMHHIENNHELDTSSTEMYQRDSWPDFLRYWLHFAVLIWIELPYYTLRTKKYGWTQALIGGLLAWAGAIFMLAKYVNLLATVYVFCIPHVIAMSAMAFGNWSQHIFVNPADRHSNYALAYNCIDTPVNQTTFNDGYHIIHHLNARLHWTEIPQYFYDTKDKHEKAGSLTFRNIHFFDVGIMVMTKQLRKLVENHYVHIGPKESAPTVDEIEAKLRAWLLPVPAEELGKKAK